MEELHSNGVEIYQFPVDDETVADLNARMNVSKEGRRRERRVREGRERGGGGKGEGGRDNRIREGTRREEGNKPAICYHSYTHTGTVTVCSGGQS